MLVLRTQRVMFGCPAGNIDGGYGIKIATDQMFVIILIKNINPCGPERPDIAKRDCSKGRTHAEPAPV